MINPLLPKSVMTKTLLSMGLGLCLPGLAFISYNAVRTYQHETQQFLSEHQSDVEILAFALESPLWDFAPEGARPVLKNYLEGSEVIFVKIYDEKSQLFIEETAEDRSSKKPLLLEKDILRDSKKIGRLEISFSTEKIMRKAKEAIFHDLLGLCSLLLAAYIIIYLLFQHLILKRMKLISKQANQMVAGELNTPFDWDSGDEINQLGVALESARQTLSRLITDLKSNQSMLESTNSHLEEKVDEKAKQLVQAAKMSSLGEMAAGIAHEINNPLTIIQGKASLLLSGIDSPDLNREKMKKHAERIVETTERIAKIVKGLRNFSRSGESDPMQLSPLKNLVEDALALCAERIKKEGVALKLDPIPDLQISCRASEISQVLINLLNNSFDAIREMANQWISIRFELEKEKIFIIVQDCGAGIPPEVSKRIMQPFFTTKEVGKGTGLGLSISKGIIENHRGRIWYDG